MEKGIKQSDFGLYQQCINIGQKQHNILSGYHFFFICIPISIYMVVHITQKTTKFHLYPYLKIYCGAHYIENYKISFASLSQNIWWCTLHRKLQNFICLLISKYMVVHITQKTTKFHLHPYLKIYGGAHYTENYKISFASLSQNMWWCTLHRKLQKFICVPISKYMVVHITWKTTKFHLHPYLKIYGGAHYIENYKI